MECQTIPDLKSNYAAHTWYRLKFHSGCEIYGTSHAYKYNNCVSWSSDMQRTYETYTGRIGYESDNNSFSFFGDASHIPLIHSLDYLIGERIQHRNNTMQLGPFVTCSDCEFNFDRGRVCVCVMHQGLVNEKTEREREKNCVHIPLRTRKHFDYDRPLTKIYGKFAFFFLSSWSCDGIVVDGSSRSSVSPSITLAIRTQLVLS